MRRGGWGVGNAVKGAKIAKELNLGQKREKKYNLISEPISISQPSYDGRRYFEYI